MRVPATLQDLTYKNLFIISCALTNFSIELAPLSKDDDVLVIDADLLNDVSALIEKHQKEK